MNEETMDLGKVFKTQMSCGKNFPTIWLINKLNEINSSDNFYDTIELTWLFSLILDNYVYPISLYIKKRPLAKQKYIDTKMSFSTIKKKYANRGYELSECECDEFLSIFAQGFQCSLTPDGFDFMLPRALQFCAKGSDKDDIDINRKTNYYYIIGGHSGKRFNAPSF